ACGEPGRGPPARAGGFFVLVFRSGPRARIQAGRPAGSDRQLDNSGHSGTTMNTQEMMRILDSIARDRNIDRSLLIEDLEQAMVTAARKHYNTLDLEEFTCSVDPLSGAIQIYRHGEPLEMPPEAFGRIAAQTFKQVMIQRFRDDERNSILEEFSKRVGEIQTGTAQRYEGGALIVAIDRAEAVMLRSEQIPGEMFNPG